MSLTSKELILFDLDGTLTQSMEGVARSVAYSLTFFGIQEDWRNLSSFVGPPLQESYRRYGLAQQDILPAIRHYRERYNTVGYLENKPYDGIPEMLDKLEKAGLLMGVATSKPERITRQVLDAFGLSRYFSIISASQEAVDDPKPVILRRAVRKAGYAGKLDKVLMVGDRVYDIDAAHREHIQAVGVRYGYARPGELEKAQPDALCGSVEELTRLLLSLSKPVREGQNA